MLSFKARDVAGKGRAGYRAAAPQPLPGGVLVLGMLGASGGLGDK
jgi:hypothetical protein